ncbi:ATP-dependent helicase [Streptomyces sp. CAI-121]|uniref:UvrD-helicase domain-containing protein n=1 Tax=unclassified Streptomyces TaxID=2593676 RepID=UPI001587ABAA|nr:MULTISPECIES: UvrD-helicase domain-containing protein [unclassified Streptomyces]NUV67929.1 ATP-dependent helicase [Streptomyces sp. CAI-121]NUW14513.1 ATP-dependent helicase [Streptomyces sp. CAI-68]
MTPRDPSAATDTIAVLRAEAAAAQHALVNMETSPGRIVRAEACPGAGKTRTIVERHLASPTGPRQGRALVSFTKVAGREIRKRCVDEGRPELAQFPHFIGTFDAFVWRHLLRPYLLPKPGKIWQRLEEWSDHPQARRDGASLDDFSFSYGRDVVRISDPQPIIRRLPHRFRRDEEGRQKLTLWAASAMQRLWSQGYLSGDQLRDMALHLLSDPERRKRIARVLLTRFSEIVIDESQDCSHEDLRIVDMLRELDIPLLLVGDPDQSIYGFRNLVSLTAAPPKTLSSTAPDHRLTHNWRSTQVICDLAHTLRTSNAPCDTAVGPYHAEAPPILLLPTTGRKDAAWLGDFGAAAEQLAIPQSQCFVIAHGNSTLPKGLTGTRVPPSDQLGRIIWATAVLRSPGASTRHQERAHKVLREAVLRHWYGQPDTPEPVNLAHQGLSPLELHVAEQSVLRALPSLDMPAAEWSRAAHSVLTAKAGLLGLVPQVQRAYPCKKHGKAAWQIVGFGAPSSPHVSVGRASTVHGVKGDQADAVLVVIPAATPEDSRSTDLVKAWAEGPDRVMPGETGEALRVLYVAATRARRLLAFALEDDHLAVIATFLARRGVPFRALREPQQEQLRLSG